MLDLLFKEVIGHEFSQPALFCVDRTYDSADQGTPLGTLRVGSVSDRFRLVIGEAVGLFFRDLVLRWMEGCR